MNEMGSGDNTASENERCVALEVVVNVIYEPVTRNCGIHCNAK